MNTPKYEDLVGKHRKLWKKFPENFRLRIHRALSWLRHWGDLPKLMHFDTRFIVLWIGFNALYARYPKKFSKGKDNTNELEKVMEYFKILVPLDKDRRIYKVAQHHEKRIEGLLENQYICSKFWINKLHAPRCKNWHDFLKSDQRTFKRNIVRSDDKSVLAVLRILFDRLITIRNQLVHGSASQDEGLALEQVVPGARIMSDFLPVFVELTMENYNVNWGTTFYPRVCGKTIEPL